MNKFRMRTDVLNYSLGGMGCSAGLISVDVAQRVLQCVAPLPLSCRGLCSCAGVVVWPPGQDTPQHPGVGCEH